MSWFTDIAGKAEDLLNRVDKTAATALQNKQKSSYSANISQDSATTYSTYTPDIGSTSYSTYTDILYRTSPSHRPTSGVAVTPSKKTLPTRTDTESDEKLMEFLNSQEPLSNVSNSKTMLMQEKEKPDYDSSSDSSAAYCAPGPVDDMRHIEEEMQTSSAGGDFNAIQQKNDSVIVEIPPQDLDMHILSNSEESRHTQSELSIDKPGDGNSLASPVEFHALTEDVREAANDEAMELVLAVKRAEHAEAEMKRMQKKLDHWNSQISGNDRQVRELHDRETDLLAAMDAKDSQLAVLKVRLNEADEELQTKKIILDDLKVENERIIREQAEASLCQNQMLDNLRQKLQQTEAELDKEKASFFALQSEHIQRMCKMEEEQKHLAENFINVQKKWSEMKDKNKDLSSQLKTVHANLENLQQEYGDYKLKAQRILQSKERLIVTLKESNGDIDHHDNKEGTYALLLTETEELKQERETLREELRRTAEMAETYKTEIQELEKMSQNDSHTAREHLRNLEEQFNQEKLYKEEIELLNNQLKDELKFHREDLSRTKGNFQSRIQDRDTEIEKLRRQLMAKSLSTASQDELESRLHALTENLIQKQTIVEALSTEKNSLVLQLERLEQQLKEVQMYGSQHHTVVGVNNSEPDRKFKQTAMVDNPFDSTLTRRVKRMYGSIDAFSIRLGVFFRRYPVARVFIIVYMLLLHLWVMVVLLTYQPEIHY